MKPWAEGAVINDLVAEFGEDTREEIASSLDLNKGRWDSFGTCGSFKADGTEYNIIPSEGEAYDIAIKVVEEELETEPAMFNESFLQNHIDQNKIREYYWDGEHENNLESLRDSFEDDPDTFLEEHADDFKEISWEPINKITKPDLIVKVLEKLSHSSAKTLSVLLVERLEALENSSVLDLSPATEDEVTTILNTLSKLFTNRYLEDVLDEIATNQTSRELENPLGWLREMLSNEDLTKEVIKRGWIDIQAAAKEAVGGDGWEHFLSIYDDKYTVTTNRYVYFRED